MNSTKTSLLLKLVFEFILGAVLCGIVWFGFGSALDWPVIVLMILVILAVAFFAMRQDIMLYKATQEV